MCRQPRLPAGSTLHSSSRSPPVQALGPVPTAPQAMKRTPERHGGVRKQRLLVVDGVGGQPPSHKVAQPEVLLQRRQQARDVAGRQRPRRRRGGRGGGGGLVLSVPARVGWGGRGGAAYPVQQRLGGGRAACRTALVSTSAQVKCSSQLETEGRKQVPSRPAHMAHPTPRRRSPAVIAATAAVTSGFSAGQAAVVKWQAREEPLLEGDCSAVQGGGGSRAAGGRWRALRRHAHLSRRPFLLAQKATACNRAPCKPAGAVVGGLCRLGAWPRSHCCSFATCLAADQYAHACRGPIDCLWQWPGCGQ